ncbi:hypothetical protein D3C85_953690 [compost metagenome]
MHREILKAQLQCRTTGLYLVITNCSVNKQGIAICRMKICARFLGRFKCLLIGKKVLIHFLTPVIYPDRKIIAGHDVMSEYISTSVKPNMGMKRIV